MMEKYDIIIQILWKAGISIKIKEDNTMGFEKSRNLMEKRREERLNTEKKSDKMKKMRKGKKLDSLKTSIKSIFGYYYD